MIQLIYISHSTQFDDQAALNTLLRHSRKNNHARNLTGMLLYHNKQFFQVLEGERDAVYGLFEIIQKDERHRACRKMAEFAITRREFSDWSMAYHGVSSTDAMQLGFNDFMLNSNDFKPFEQQSEAYKLLVRFKDKAQAQLELAAG